jgi:hypothetical protein
MLNENFVPPVGTVVVLKPFYIVIVLLDVVITQDGADGKVEEKLVQEL